MDRRKNRKKQVRAVLPVLLAAGLMTAGLTAFGEDYYEIGAEDGASDLNQAPTDGGSLFEDPGDTVSAGDGISEDTLQDAIASGNQDALDRIADGVTSDEEASLQSEINETQEESGLGETIGVLEDADADRIAQTLQDLSAYDSLTGSDDELRAGDYIASRMKEYGYTVEPQSFHEGFVDATGSDEQGLNIIAERGADSQTNRKNDIFLAVTHYDTRREKREGDPFSEDRTGAAVLLEAARILSPEVTDTDICFVFLSGEEDGLYGSENFLKSLDDDMKPRISGVLDVERIGYSPETFCVIRTEDGRENWVGDLVREEGLYYDSLPNETEGGETGQPGTEAVTAAAGENGGSGAVVPLLAEANLQSQGQSGQDQSGTEETDEAWPGTGMETETETEAEAPSPWNYVSDRRYTQSTYAEAGIPAVSLTQYFGDREETAALNSRRDEKDQEETYAPGVTGQGTGAEDQPETGAAAESEPETVLPAEDQPETGAASESAEEDGTLRPDADLLAKAADITAEVIASVMDPA